MWFLPPLLVIQWLGLLCVNKALNTHTHTHTHTHTKIMDLIQFDNSHIEIAQPQSLMGS